MLCTNGVCQSPSCTDGLQNNGETDIDCGGSGSCPRCGTSKKCSANTDCTSANCDGAKCLASANNDNVMNGDETDVDCGGTSGNTCAVNKKCKITTDCNNMLCTNGVCQSPSCTDGLQNNGETDIDCGGSGSCPRCGTSQKCSANTDCTSANCDGTKCLAAANNDNVRNGDETDVDCGGTSANKCAVNKICKITTDCNNMLCGNGVCQSPSCTDGLQNNGETDIDCGGSGSCPRCGTSKKCSASTDCTSANCDGTKCLASANNDNVMNGDETDVDCGGTSGNTCAVNKKCKITADCNNILCISGFCQSALCTDGLQNNGETDVDCGGSGLCPRCAIAKKCSANTDCGSAKCDGTKCLAPANNDNVMNGDETDVDCGGTSGNICAVGSKCKVDTDCSNGYVFFDGADSVWPLEQNVTSNIRRLDGTLVNSPTYVTPGINNGYALQFVTSSSQGVQIPNYQNFAYTSFTVEMWIKPTTLSAGSTWGLFSQIESVTPHKLLHLCIRDQKLYMGFYFDDLSGTTTLSTNTWYHAAFVYNYLTQQKTIYLNGVQDAIGSSSNYQGTSGIITIGYYDNKNYYDGFMDQVSLTMNAKTASEILDDATLTTWHSFDCGLQDDSGPNKISGTANNVVSGNGRIPGYVLLGVANKAFSMSLWINPTSTSGGTLAHLSSKSDGQNWCFDVLGLSSSGNIVGAVRSGGSVQEVVGPTVSANIWTHVAITASTGNGVRLYVNGVSSGTKSIASIDTSAVAVFMTLGSPLQGTSCPKNSIVASVYQGLLDEYRVYSRELTAAEVTKLAAP
ncbi:unnamed protein product [Adineta ricciae]|uniref:LamG-like jellyroll fold domain-containing protein n=1 Tax=Adineta ricciae TaxID=249248 RepID=A0A814YBW5_ADIRI|nr:unnamed protein product [Adineta ricciae]